MVHSVCKAESDGNILEKVSATNPLGVWLTEDLDWN